ncbi:MAG: IS5/IS1182 family transposase [Dehalococcoidia bacterium]|nr:IS5/IS1182 family transposase [Dehalococcoidia bacterium]
MQTHDHASDEETRDWATFDLRWQVALGVPVGSQPFAKSTLQEFRAQLVLHEEQGKLFLASLALIKRKGWFRGQRLTVAEDTTFILGRGAVKDTYNLLADGILQVLRVLAAQAGEEVAAYAARQELARYVAEQSLKSQSAVDWDDPAALRRFLAGIVADADRVLEVVRVAREALEPESVAEGALKDAAGLLARLLLQDIERREDGPALRQGVAKDRVVSVHDPEMRHGRKSQAKRFDGHKAQVVVDTDEAWITAVAVLPGNAPDHEQALAMVEASEANTGCAVATTVVDCAYGDGGTRQAFAEAGRRLVAKVATMTNQGHFPKTVFVLDVAAGRCTCPAGVITHDLRPQGNGGQVFHFAATSCHRCPLRIQCVRGRGGRTVQVHPQETLLQEARAFQSSPAFQEYRTRRQVVEHRLARLVQLGIRQARYFGAAKTLFQLCLAATVANLTLLAHKGAALLPAVLFLALLLARVAAAYRPAPKQIAARQGPMALIRRPSFVPAASMSHSYSRTFKMAVSRPDF